MNKDLTMDELLLVGIYNEGSRLDTMAAMKAALPYYEPEEEEVKELLRSAMEKLSRMREEDYAGLDLTRGFDK